MCARARVCMRVCVLVCVSAYAVCVRVSACMTWCISRLIDVAIIRNSLAALLALYQISSHVLVNVYLRVYEEQFLTLYIAQ